MDAMVANVRRCSIRSENSISKRSSSASIRFTLACEVRPASKRSLWSLSEATSSASRPWSRRMSRIVFGLVVRHLRTPGPWCARRPVPPRRLSRDPRGGSCSTPGFDALARGERRGLAVKDDVAPARRVPTHFDRAPVTGGVSGRSALSAASLAANRTANRAATRPAAERHTPPPRREDAPDVAIAEALDRAGDVPDADDVDSDVHPIPHLGSRCSRSAIRLPNRGSVSDL